VQHACKLLPPWPIKGGAVPQPQEGGRRTAITHTLSAFSTILALASINTSGTWRPGLLSHRACSPPLRAPRCEAIQCPENTTVGRTAPAGTRINPASLVASTGPSRGRSQRLLLVSVGTTFRTDSRSPRVLVVEVVILTLVGSCCRRTLKSLYPCPLCSTHKINPGQGQGRRQRSGE
jgi:hypothetical protein